MSQSLLARRGKSAFCLPLLSKENNLMKELDSRVVDFYALKYEEIQFLGEGNFSKVYKVRTKGRGNRRRADTLDSILYPYYSAKILETNGDEEMSLLAEKEYNILVRLNHPNILKAIDFIQGPSRSVIISEMWGVGQNLNSLVITTSSMHIEYPFFTNEFKWTFHVFLQLLDACTYLHEKRIIHRDISPDNILMNDVIIKKTQDEVKFVRNLKIKLIDFNASANILKDGNMSVAGKLNFTSPETLASFDNLEISEPGMDSPTQAETTSPIAHKKSKKQSISSETLDIWSIGAVVYFIISRGKSPLNVFDYSSRANCVKHARSFGIKNFESASLNVEEENPRKLHIEKTSPKKASKEKGVKFEPKMVNTLPTPQSSPIVDYSETNTIRATLNKDFPWPHEDLPDSLHHGLSLALQTDARKRGTIYEIKRGLKKGTSMTDRSVMKRMSTMLSLFPNTFLLRKTDPVKLTDDDRRKLSELRPTSSCRDRRPEDDEESPSICSP